MKPTNRATSFIVAAIIFYFFANQTQTGWLYVVSALLGGVVLAAYVLNRSALGRIVGQRDLGLSLDDTVHEGDDIHIILTLKSERRLPAAHLNVIETCPLAAPDSSERQSRMFIPSLPQPVEFAYDTQIYRRGIQTFSPIQVQSKAPFGLFRREGEIAVDTSLLVYPEVRELSHFALLDKQPAAELSNPRAGLGTEIIGVRPYRSGDSPRHIHWRSVARRGRLISKEFAEETQPGITVVLDRYSPNTSDPDNKHTPFEMAVKCAVSMADYALRYRYPLYMAMDTEDFAIPQGAVIRDTLLETMARVQPRTISNLVDVLTYQPMQRYVAIAMSYPNFDVLESLIALQHRGAGVYVTLPDPVTYAVEHKISASEFAQALAGAGIDYCLIPYGKNWTNLISDDVQEDSMKEYA